MPFDVVLPAGALARELDLGRKISEKDSPHECLRSVG